MSKYFQPLINFGPYPTKGSTFLADPTYWFDRVKVLERDKTPRIVRVKDIPKRVIKEKKIHLIFVVIKKDHLLWVF